MSRKICAILPLVIAVALATTGCSSVRSHQPAPYVPKTSYTPTSPEAEQKDQPVTNEDLRILDRADAILGDSTKWDRDHPIRPVSWL